MQFLISQDKHHAINTAHLRTLTIHSHVNRRSDGSATHYSIAAEVSSGKTYRIADNIPTVRDAQELLLEYMQHIASPEAITSDKFFSNPVPDSNRREQETPVNDNLKVPVHQNPTFPTPEPD